jgi:hypothetical protein
MLSPTFLKYASRGAVLAALLLCRPAFCQWLNYATPGIPRLPDGKPNLNAPAPTTADGKSDLSGLWFLAPSVEVFRNSRANNSKPWAQAVVNQNIENWGRDDPTTFKCLPRGPGAFFGALPAAGWTQIVQTPGLIALLYADLTFRRIFIDGRELEKDPNPSFMGYSVGRWEGDTLVVESNGFNNLTWLGEGGSPHTEALRVTERFHRIDFGHMDLQVTFDDPGAFNGPWTMPVKANRVVDTDMLEYLTCEDEKDLTHIRGKTTDDLKQAVKVAPEVLAQYAGVYEMSGREATGSVRSTITVSLLGGELLINKVPLIPLSDARFSWEGRQLEFFKDAEGKVTHLSWPTPEGEAKGVRTSEPR